MQVSVISVAGTFRKGKSFLLNFFLRYLNASEEKRRSGDWIYGGDRLNGFSWRGGKWIILGLICSLINE